MSGDVVLSDLAHMPVGARVSMRCSLRHLQLKRTVSGDDWAVLTIAQDDETVSVLALPHVFAPIDPELLVPDALISLTDQVHRTSGGTTQVAASTLGQSMR